MGYVASRKFCCCLPVRFGVFVMTVLGIVGGAVIGGVGWYETQHLGSLHLTKNNEIALYISAVSYTILGIISFFGLAGVIIKKKGFVSMYSTLVWLHLGFSIGTGAYFIYTLFHKVGDEDVSNCVGSSSSDFEKDVCKKAFEVGRGIIIGLYIFVWLIELWGCIIVADYVGQLGEEEALAWSKETTPVAPAAGLAPPMATTYNYGAQYAFSATDHSYGRDAPNNV